MRPVADSTATKSHTRPGPALAGLVALLFLAGVAAAVMVVAGQGPTAIAHAASPAPDPVSGLRLIASGEGSIILELHTPQFDVGEGLADGPPCSALSVAGYGRTDRAGYPGLPVRGALLGIPPGVEVDLVVLDAEAIDLPGTFDLCPVARPMVELDGEGRMRAAGYRAVRDPAAYAADAFYPAAPAELVSTGWIRGQRVAQVRFHPFQVNPATGRLRHYRTIRLALRMEAGDADVAYTPAPAAADPFDALLRGTLLNYEAARAWRVVPPPSSGLPLASPHQAVPAYKVYVEEDGLYQITPADLQVAGADVGAIDPRTFQLHYRGQEAAIHVSGQADGSFDAGDALLFYGQGSDSKYSAANVYWLTWGTAAGRRMDVVDGTPAGTDPVPASFRTTHRLEEDHIYQAPLPSGPENDHWYWGRIWASTPTVASYETTLAHLATAPVSATVRGLFHGYDATPHHHTRVHLNGHLVDDATWAPTAEYSFTVDVPQSYLVEGTNTITVECPLDGGISEDYFLVNRFEIDYDDGYVAEDDQLFFDGDAAGTWEYQAGGFTTDEIDVLDVTEPLSPSHILSTTVEPGGGAYTVTFRHTIAAEHRYVALSPARRLSPADIEADVPSDLHAATNGADYIIITHPDFITAVQPLAAHRAASGLRTVVVDVQDVYDEFAGGHPEPQGIRDFLAYAYAHWTPPAPAYVLLAGDANYDFRDNLGVGEPTYVPPYLAEADPWIGETAADNRYACVSGDDPLPDLHLGRLPVKTAAEAEAAVAKILAYEAGPAAQDWHGQVLVVADNADQGGDFAGHSDHLVDHHLPAPYSADKIYYQVTHPTAAAAKAALLAAVDDGRLLVNYAGHASIQFWAFEHLLDLADVAALDNEHLPFAVPMTCLEGYYLHPSLPNLNLSSLAETFVRNPGGGAIASWSATGMGLSDGHAYLNEGLFQALFADDVAQVGPATTQAKLYLYAGTAGYRELLDTYVLFGDPALALQLLPADLSLAKTVDPPGSVLAGQAITYTLTFSNAGPATAHHVVLTDVLPSGLLSPTIASAGAAIAPRPDSRLVWDVADLAVGDGGVVTITAVVDAAFAGPLTNTASIATTAADADPDNDEASRVTHVVRTHHPVYLPLIVRGAQPLG